MKKKNVASMAMAAMMAAGALPMNAWAAPEVNHDETLTIEVYDVAANYQGMQTVTALSARWRKVMICRLGKMVISCLAVNVSAFP